MTLKKIGWFEEKSHKNYFYVKVRSCEENPYNQWKFEHEKENGWWERPLGQLHLYAPPQSAIWLNLKKVRTYIRTYKDRVLPSRGRESITCPTIAWARSAYDRLNQTNHLHSHPKHRKSHLQNPHAQFCPILPEICMSNTRTCRTSLATSRHHVVVMEDEKDHTPDIFSYLSGSPGGTSKNPQIHYSAFPAWAKTFVPRHHDGCYHPGCDT